MKKISKNRLINTIINSFFYFFDKHDIGKDFKILSISCGDGYYEKLIYENYKDVNLTGTDVIDGWIKKEDIEFFHKAGIWEFVRVQPEKELPFPDNSFDLVYMNDVIEHVENPFSLVKEQYRLLKPGGSIIVGTPNLLRIANIGKIFFGLLDFPIKIGEHELHTGSHHQQEFTEWNIVGILKEVGFSGIEIRYCFWGMHFLNFQFKAFPQKGIGRLMCHYLTICAVKPKIIQ